MAFWTGGVTVGSTGSQAYTGVGFQGNDITFRVGAKNGSSSVVQHAIGTADGTRQNCESVFGDGSGWKSQRTNSYSLIHYERVSGTITEVLKFAFTSFDADGFTINVTTASANYTVDVEVRS